MREDELRPTAVELCMEIRAGRTERAEYLLDRILTLKDKPQMALELLGAVQNALTTASRLRDQSLFIKLLTKCRQPLLLFLVHPHTHKAYMELMNALLFVVCDKKIDGARYELQVLCRAFFILVKPELREAWSTEALSLAARILRRGWLEQGQWLLRLVLKQLWKRGDKAFIQRTLGRLELHMILSCRYDDVTKTLEYYKVVFSFYKLLLERALKLARTGRQVGTGAENPGGDNAPMGASSAKLVNRSEAFDYLVMTLRSVREWLCNSATTLMIEELELFEEWDRVMKEQKLSPKVWQRERQLLQLELKYWNLTKPKSSRKQFRYLQEMLEPDFIKPELQALLEEV